MGTDALGRQEQERLTFPHSKAPRLTYALVSA